MQMQVTLEGGKQLEKKLLVLEQKTAKKVVRKATRAATKPVQKATKENATTMVGGDMGNLLKKHIVVRAFRKQKRGSYGLSVKLRPGVDEFDYVSKDGKRSYIPAAIEYGHDNAAAIPFMRKAADSELKNSELIMKAELARGIETMAKQPA